MEKYLTDDRILLFGKKDNFWEMGDTVPAAPAPRYMWIAEVMQKEKRWMERHW
jgi:alanyl-tRNA synthetase